MPQHVTVSDYDPAWPEAYARERKAITGILGDNCLAMVDGKPVSLVGRSYVVDLIEAVNAIVFN